MPKPTQESATIRRMFAEIAPRYDFLNHLLSARTDIAWRRMVVRETVRPSMRRILDVACGTGDLAVEIRAAAHPDCTVVGADFVGEMLVRALDKPRADGITWIEADGLQLPFRDESFDLATIAFGLRNMESLDAGLQEMRRVLRPGGQLAVLEFTTPENPIIRAAYMPYFLHVLPRIAATLSRKSAYMYLGQSVVHFPRRRELAACMKRNGFRRVRHCAISLGIAALHIATR